MGVTWIPTVDDFLCTLGINRANNFYSMLCNGASGPEDRFTARKQYCVTYGPCFRSVFKIEALKGNSRDPDAGFCRGGRSETAREHDPGADDSDGGA